MSDIDTEGRTVEVRLHCGSTTYLTNTIFTVVPRVTWPTRLTMPSGGAAWLAQLQLGRHRWGSWFLLNGTIVWEFTWRESTEWTVEEFMYNGDRWRLEYRTRYPVFDPEPATP